VQSPAHAHTYHHAKSWLTRPGPVVVGIAVLEDITIGDNAVLTATPSVLGFYARDIIIGKEGRLRFTGGSVKVRCKTLSGPSLLARISILANPVPAGMAVTAVLWHC
jgi:hypothetical protein